MNPQLKWKFVFILIVILVCIYGLIGIPFPTSFGQIRQNLSDRIHLGLDLRGGSHLVLQVQVDEAIGQRTDQTYDALHKALQDKNINPGMSRVDNTHILVSNLDPASSSTFNDIVTNQFTDWTMAPAAGVTNGYLLTMKPSSVADLRTSTMDQSLETITRRINALGLTEPTIAFTGRADNEILVEMPGEGDPTRAMAVIQAGGQLELRRVADEQQYASETEALAAHGGVMPAGTEIVPGTSDTTSGQAPATVFYILDRAPIVTGQDLVSATPEPSTNYPGQYEVAFHLSTAAAARFGPFTEANIGHRMAIVLDHKVYTAPVINGRIDDSGQIEGNFSQESAQDLLLSSGPVRCRPRSSTWMKAPSVPRSGQTRSERVCGPRSAALSS